MGLLTDLLGDGNATSRAVFADLDASSPLGSRFTVSKFESNPLFDTTDTGVDFPTILWPWVVRAADYLDTPLGTYYLYFSTDHEGADGMIGLAYADNLTGPWTIHGEVYQDTSSGSETETPSVVWDVDEEEFILYYQQIAPAGAVASQVTCYATSPDGITWTRQGIAVDIPDVTEYPAPAHTGYFRPFRIGDTWVGYHLLSGTTGCRFGMSYSLDGRTWRVDPRPLGYGGEWVDTSVERVEWNTGNVILWRGQWLWIGLLSSFASAAETRTSRFVVAPLSQDLRSFIGKPRQLFGVTQAWETTYMQQGHAFVNDDGRLWLVYRSGDGTTDPFAFGLAEVQA